MKANSQCQASCAEPEGDGDRDARPQGEELRPGLPGCSHGVVEALPVTGIMCEFSRDANHDFSWSSFCRVRDRSNRAILVENENRSREDRRPSSGSPISDDAPIFDQLTSPDAPGFDAFESFVETRDPQRTSSTDRLGSRNVDVVVAEEQRSQRSVAVCAACRGTIRNSGEIRCRFLGCDGHRDCHGSSPCAGVWVLVGMNASDGADRFEDKQKGRRVIPAASCVLVVVVNLRE